MTDAVKANGRRISYSAPAGGAAGRRAPRLPVVGQARRHGAAVATPAPTDPTRRAERCAGAPSPDSAAGAARDRGVDRRRGDELVDLAVLLEDRLEERQVEPGLDVEGHRARGDVLAGAAQHERVEQLVGDEVAGRREVLGAPGRRDPVAQLRVEAGALQRDVGQDRHHVDDERLALRPVERLAARLVDERQQVAGRLDRVRIAPGRHGRRRAAARGSRAATGSTRPGARGSRRPSGRPARRTPCGRRR